MMRWLIRALVLGLFMGGVSVAYHAKQTQKRYDETMRALAQMSETKALGEYRLKELLETLSLGLYENELKAKIASLQAESRGLGKALVRASYVAIALWLAAYVAALLVSLREGLFWGALVSMAFLYHGLTMTLLYVTLHKEVPYLGDVVFSHESKSLIDTIKKLFIQKEYAIGTVIVLFSVAVPWLKSIAMLLVALLKNVGHAERFVRFFKHLGKWSMLDVFVVATLLVFLSMREKEISRAVLGEGINFFLGYVLLSLVLSVIADRFLRARR